MRGLGATATRREVGPTCRRPPGRGGLGAATWGVDECLHAVHAVAEMPPPAWARTPSDAELGKPGREAPDDRPGRSCPEGSRHLSESVRRKGGATALEGPQYKPLSAGHILLACGWIRSRPPKASAFGEGMPLDNPAAEPAAWRAGDMREALASSATRGRGRGRRGSPAAWTALSVSSRRYNLLQANHRYGVTLAQIMARLECSRATVRRVITELRDFLGAPLVWERGLHCYVYRPAEGEDPWELQGLDLGGD